MKIEWKNIICVVLTLIIVLIQGVVFAETNTLENAENIPDIYKFSGYNYVVYQNTDNVIMLAVIKSESNKDICLVAESNEQSSTIEEFVYPYNKNGQTVDPFDNLSLTVETNDNTSVDKYTLIDNYWVLSESNNEKIISSTFKKIIYTNISVAERLYKPYKFWLNNNYNGKNFYKYYFYQDSDGNHEQIVFSDDAINYNVHLELPDKNTSYTLTYANGLYMAVGNPEYPIIANKPITKDNISKWMLVIDENLNIIHEERLEVYRKCLGYYNGYFYFSDTFGDVGNGTTIKKSSDGINYISINDTDSELSEAKEYFQNELYKGNSGYVYSYDKKENSSYLDYNGAHYKIIYENEYTHSLAVPTYGEEWLSILFDKDVASSLTTDGIYKKTSIPYRENNYMTNAIIFKAGEYVLIDYDPAFYYRIHIDGAESTYVRLNDTILGFSQPPVMEGDRTLVPMRFLFEQMGAEVDWNDATQTATAKISARGGGGERNGAGENTVTFSIDNTTAYVNGAETSMDVPARLINDQTFVPLRFLSENLGYNVEWDEANNTAVITTE